MRGGEPLPINILGIVHEDAGSGRRMLDRQSRDVRVFQPPAENVKSQAPEVRVNVAGDCIRSIFEMLTECGCGLIAVALKEISRWSEGKILNFPLEFRHQERFALAQEKEFLDAAAVLLRELRSEPAIQGFGLFEGGKLSVCNKKPVVALKEVGEDQYLIPCGCCGPGFKPGQSLDSDPCAGNKLFQIGRASCRGRE